MCDRSVLRRTEMLLLFASRNVIRGHCHGDGYGTPLEANTLRMGLISRDDVVSRVRAES